MEEIPEKHEQRILAAFQRAVVEGDPFQEKNAGKNIELVESVLDALYVSTEGRIWEGGCKMTYPETQQAPELRGVTITFLPFLSPETGKLGNGLFFLQKKGEQELTAYFFLACHLADEGHDIIQGKYHLKDDSPITIENLYTSIASLGLSAVSPRDI